VRAKNTRGLHWHRRDILGLLGIVSFVVALGISFGVVTGGWSGANIAAITLGIGSLALGCAGRLAAVAALTLTAGIFQGILAAATSSASALWLDDACLPGLAACVFVLARRNRQLKRVAIIGVVFVALSGIAIVTASDIAVAVYQFRQISVPVVLLAAGYVADRTTIVQFGRYLLVIGGIYLVLLFCEIAGFRLVDPWMANGLNPFLGGVSEHNLGRDLPPNYYYYAGSERLERAGGLHFNPPGASIFVASFALYAQLALSRGGHLLYQLAVILGAIATLGRAGGAYLAIALTQRFASRTIGRVAFGFLVIVGGVFTAEYFSSQGNRSDTHTEGLLAGVAFALTHPVGSGFGTIGNITGSASAEGATGESLVGLFLASYGWAGLLAVVALLTRGLWLGRELPGVALTAAMTVALFTESASGLALTLPMWLLAGVGLQSMIRLGQEGWLASSRESDAELGTRTAPSVLRPPQAERI
jgi:hypothetical protein